jgi:hypothetical protein
MWSNRLKLIKKFTKPDNPNQKPKKVIKIDEFVALLTQDALDNNQSSLPEITSPRNSYNLDQTLIDEEFTFFGHRNTNFDWDLSSAISAQKRRLKILLREHDSKPPPETPETPPKIFSEKKKLKKDLLPNDYLFILDMTPSMDLLDEATHYYKKIILIDHHATLKKNILHSEHPVFLNPKVYTIWSDHTPSAALMMFQICAASKTFFFLNFGPEFYRQICWKSELISEHDTTFSGRGQQTQAYVAGLYWLEHVQRAVLGKRVDARVLDFVINYSVENVSSHGITLLFFAEII